VVSFKNLVCCSEGFGLMGARPWWHITQQKQHKTKQKNHKRIN